MRLIDADATPNMGISDFSVMFRKVIDNIPTVDLWHYPAKGEYPQNNKWVFVYLNDDTATVGLYCSWAKLKWIDNYENAIYNEDIVAWQYIVPPKEEEREQI